MERKMKDIEMKKKGFQKAIYSLLEEWKDFQALLDFSPKTPLVQNENPMRGKLKEIDLNEGSFLDVTELPDIERQQMIKLAGNEGLCNEKLREIDVKMREIEFSKGFIEERAKELELREKEIDKGFRDLEVKKIKFAEKSDEVFGRAKELNLRAKEIDDGFRELELKKMEFAERSNAKLVEIEEQKLKLKERWEKLKFREKEVERAQVLCGQRFEEIVGKVREVDSSRKYVEEYAKELEVKRKELDIGFKELEVKRKELENGFKELELKKIEFAEKTNKFAATNFSNADISMTQTKRRRSSYDLRTRAPARTEVPAPRVNQTAINKNSEGCKTFWTCCTSCKFKFKYHKMFVKKILKCRNCTKNFIGYELDAQSIPPESNVHPVEQMEFSAKTDKIAGISSSHADVNMNQMKTKGYTCAEGKSLYENDETIKQQVNQLALVTVDPDTRPPYVINDSESNQNRGSLPAPVSVDCPYPEFCDFDKDKYEKCFSVDQIWACYDKLDVMPMLYGHIRKVFSPDFKLQVTFLKANPKEQNEINWVNAGLPMVCGKFIHDDTVETSKRLMFSHQIHCKKGSEDGTYLIYPRKGETWGMFKDWNIGWSSDPANHKTFKYEMVEILSDFKQETGVEICYLVKVKGFVSVFKRIVKHGILTFVIPPGEMLRFSHSVPSVKLSGAERPGVPSGAFELDPASLPVDPNKLFCQPEDMETTA